MGVCGLGTRLVVIDSVLCSDVVLHPQHSESPLQLLVLGNSLIRSIIRA